MSGTLLIVIDDSAMARWLPGHFEALGWSVAHVSTGVDVVDFACGTNRCPDVALIDAVLGDDDGHVVCEDIRAACPDAYLVMTSARAGQTARLKALAAGADACLLKPFALSQLETLLDRRHEKK